MSAQNSIDRLNAIKARIRTNLVAQGITVPEDSVLEEMAEQILSVAGEPGPKGDTGVGIAKVEQTTTSTADDGNNIITVTLTNGNTYTFQVQNGSKGSQGDPGTDGTNGTSVTVTNVTESSADGGTNVVTFSDGKKVNIKNGSKGSQGNPGTNGTNGTSVTVSNVSESTADGGSNVVTFSDGKKVTIKNGSKGSTGSPGTNGTNGTNGVSATHSWNGTTLTVTSASGTSSANLKGDKGDTGDTGPAGADGKTPVKGTDYFTDAEKQEMTAAAAAAIPIDNYVPKSGTTMTGALTAQANTNYTTRQVRNIITVVDGASIPTTQNGDIVLIREA